MERKVGEIFTYKNKTYQVVQSSKCAKCAFAHLLCASLKHIRGKCCGNQRIDKIEVIFKEINNMGNNQLNIEIPEGMEIDVANTDLCSGIIKFRIKNIKYNDVYNVLKTKYDILGCPLTITNYNKTKLEAIDRLLNIARYYNQDWEPDWMNAGEPKYTIIYNYSLKRYVIRQSITKMEAFVYFKNYDDVSSVIHNSNFRDILDSIYK